MRIRKRGKKKSGSSCPGRRQLAGLFFSALSLSLSVPLCFTGRYLFCLLSLVFLCRSVSISLSLPSPPSMSTPPLFVTVMPTRLCVRVCVCLCVCVCVCSFCLFHLVHLRHCTFLHLLRRVFSRLCVVLRLRTLFFSTLSGPDRKRFALLL